MNTNEQKQLSDKNAFTRRFQPFIIYALAMLGMGIWQLLDWYYGAEDPIWHLLFYVFFMPLCSLAYGITAGEHKRPWLIPPVAGLMCALVYVCMANGGFYATYGSFSGALELSVPSFFAALIGVTICRASIWISRGKRHEKRKESKSEHGSSDSRI